MKYLLAALALAFPAHAQQDCTPVSSWPGAITLFTPGCGPVQGVSILTPYETADGSLVFNLSQSYPTQLSFLAVSPFTTSTFGNHVGCTLLDKRPGFLQRIHTYGAIPAGSYLNYCVDGYEMALMQGWPVNEIYTTAAVIHYVPDEDGIPTFAYSNTTALQPL